MSQYEESKTARRILAVVYLIIMSVLVGGSYLAQQNKQDQLHQPDDTIIVYDKPVYGP